MTATRANPDAASRPVIVVTRRQVKAAQVAIKAHKKLGRPIPPGLQRIADTKRSTA